MYLYKQAEWYPALIVAGGEEYIEDSIPTIVIQIEMKVY